MEPYTVASAPPTASEAAALSLTEKLAAVLSDDRGRYLSMEENFYDLAQQLNQYESAMALLAGGSAKPVPEEEVEARINDRIESGRWRIPYPRTHRITMALLNDFMETRRGLSLPWWAHGMPSAKRWKKGAPFGVDKMGWPTCKRQNLKGFAAGRTLPEVLDDIEVQMQVLLESVLVGEFGVCGPHFLKESQGRGFDCVDSQNQDLIFPQFFVSTTEARGVRSVHREILERDCPQNCGPGGDPMSRERVWEALSQDMLADEPASHLLAYSPLLPASTETTLSRHLFSVVPDWAQFRNGSADQNDVDAAMSVAQEFTVLLNAFYSEMFVAGQATGATEKFHARSILALFDEFEMTFCTWAKTQDLPAAERTAFADWISLKNVNGKPPVFHVHAGMTVRAMDFLNSVAGAPWLPSKQWSRVERQLAVHPLSDASAYRAGTAQLARVSAKFVQAFISTLPTALRATMLALLGRWTAEWAKERVTSAEQEFLKGKKQLESYPNYFDFNEESGRAPKLLFLMTLLGGLSPAEVAAQSVLDFFKSGAGADLSAIYSRFTNSRKKGIRNLQMGRIVYIGSCDRTGPKSWSAFADERGVATGTIPLSRSSLSSAFELVAAASWNALAPLAAASSLLDKVKELLAELQESEAAASPLALLESALADSKFGHDYHCTVAKRELARYLSASRGRTEAELDSRIQEVLVEVAFEEPMFIKQVTQRTDSGQPAQAAADSGLRRRLHLSCSFGTDPEERAAFVSAIVARRRRSRIMHGIRGFFRRIRRGVRGLLRRRVQPAPADAAGVCEPVRQSNMHLVAASVRRAAELSAWNTAALSRLHLPRSYAQYLYSLLQNLPSLAKPVDLPALAGVSGSDIIIATDIDDTMISSGGWLLRKLSAYMGGSDTAYARGIGYPGVGALYYLLTLGFGKKLKIESSKPVQGTDGQGAVAAPSLIERSSGDVLPLVLLTARLSMRLLRPFFRPKQLYRRLSHIYNYESALLTRRLDIRGDRLVMENAQPLTSAVRGKSQRGLNKVKGIETYIRQAAEGTADRSLPLTPATKFLFAGDTFERDLEVCVSLGMRQPRALLGCLMHIAFNSAEDQAAAQGSVPSTLGGRGFDRDAKLPHGVFLFDLARNEAVKTGASTSGANPFSGALGASIRYALRLPQDALPSWGDVRCEHAQLKHTWVAAQQVSARVKRVLGVLRFSWKRDGLADLLGIESTPPLVFLKCSHIEMAKPGERPGVRFLQPTEETPSVPSVLNENGQVVPEALGLPVVMHRTVLGAATLARYLNLLDAEAAAGLTVTTVRQQRSLGPPVASLRAEQWKELMADMRMQHLLFEDVPPAAYLATYSFAKSSTLSPAAGARLRHLTCRSQREDSFLIFNDVIRSKFPVAESYEAALVTAWEAWTRIAHLHCTYEAQFSHLCTAAQPELEFLAHAVAQVPLFAEPGEDGSSTETCQLLSDNGETSRTAFEPILFGFLARLCLSSVDACVPFLGHLRDMAKLAKWRAELGPSPASGMLLENFNLPVYTQMDANGDIGATRGLSASVRTLVVLGPAEKQSKWPRLYPTASWSETARVWKQLDRCLLTPLERLAASVREALTSDDARRRDIRTAVQMVALDYEGSPIIDLYTLLQVIIAGGFQPALGDESRNSRSVTGDGYYHGIAFEVPGMVSDNVTSEKERVSRLREERENRHRTAVLPQRSTSPA
ncbi:hypothetical protein BESB_010950 [Besnoitia besnoiti]|uniref:Uncharacterized protein n=1 Tax=Besnoitia besnoiti TaxID=94643 RepID=A0A2A9MQU3_BESBE|nr:hypothetical protein BESB_010950 [Besnoitia besnoiti]PFH38753.1 hypothetical protein BESB_010950 [Besnoitia besnoiti]